MDAEHELILRLFSRAAARAGNVGHLALRIKASPNEVLKYMQGEAIPPEDVLLRAVEIILDELPKFRAEASPEVWRSLSLPQ
jgi:hypothetical protein